MSDFSNMMGKPRIHFGSLEENDRVVRQARTNGSAQAGLTLDELGDEEVEASETTSRAQAEHQAILAEFERKRLARNLAVPTDDARVRLRLRDEGEPITLFGEGPAERRDRLRSILAQKLHDRDPDAVLEESEGESDVDEKEEPEEEFYTYGPDELLDARRDIAIFSISRARQRLIAHREELQHPYPQRKKLRHEFYTNIKGVETRSLQYGDERPLSCCVFTPNSRAIATASWGGLIKLWSVPDCKPLHSFKGHTDRVSGLAFHPHSTLSQSPSALNMVSGAADGSVHLWNFNSELPMASLVGHEMRVSRVAFHPSGRYIGTASFDTTWRLWDAETTQELLLQEGHSREVFAIGFQPDGGLAATGGTDAIGRVWDMRTGKSIMVLQGHVKQILSLDWSPNGYQLVTGSEDNSMRVWDMRAAKSLYTIPAHTNLVSQVRYWHAAENFEKPSSLPWHFQDDPMSTDDAPMEADAENTMDIDGKPEIKTDTKVNVKAEVKVEGELGVGSTMRRQLLDGSFLVSSSYDGTCKLWTDGDYKPVKALTGLEGKVMSCDISGNGQFIATASYDRTFKLYATEDVPA
ncbi:U4/U6 small nuclear ribonucleoprotein Prp4 [Geranomyces variabilis]|nr:U4/U6 small nuclear ribonucleoprotein Prp4 [Geranomyces variabilis]